jgi:hypothetical protein
MTPAVMTLVVPAALAGKGGKNKDSTAPAAVDDLTAASAALGSIALTFTTVGDDGQNGTATAYDVRYASSAILTDADFDAATAVTGEPDPKASGKSQSVCVPGLTAGTTYHVALKVEDEAGNVGGLSNSASAVAGESLGDYVHVESIQAWWTLAGGASMARGAIVIVADEDGVPVAGATVNGVWTTDGSEDPKTYSGVTDCLGTVNVLGKKFTPHGETVITFTVTDITHASAEYDPDANVVTSGSAWAY